MEQSDRIVIIGAGVFGLSTAHQLARDGYNNILVLDRYTPPVPDGSSVDISRVVRFDYGDDIYLNLAHDAYKQWATDPKYKNIFFPSSYIISASSDAKYGSSYVKSCMSAMTKRGIPWDQLADAADAKSRYKTLTGELASPDFFGYTHSQAGWADAQKAISQLRDDCLELGVSFLSGRAGTVTSLETSASTGKILAVRTLQDMTIHGSQFILSAGAWASTLVNFYNSTISTAQVLGYMRLTEEEVENLQQLPIYINFGTGWFNFPPHNETKMLKVAVHGWGYTRSPDASETVLQKQVSTPPLKTVRERANFVPKDGEERLREGLREILPELADRPFERLVMCWYTDTPTGDFIMDYHPDHENLFIAGGGSGHAFKFLPILGEYVVKGWKHQLPEDLTKKWRFKTEHANDPDVFKGDGSRGGPERRELTAAERKAK